MTQESLLEILIQKAGHECIFLPKFHCELRDGESSDVAGSIFYSGDGVNIAIERFQSKIFFFFLKLLDLLPQLVKFSHAAYQQGTVLGSGQQIYISK